MPKHESQHTEPQRHRKFTSEYFGELGVLELIDITNSAKEQPERIDPVTDLIVRCIHLQEAVEGADFPVASGGLKESLLRARQPANETASQIRALKLLCEVNACLEAFKTTPVLQIAKGQKRGEPGSLTVSEELPREITSSWGFYMQEHGDYLPYHMLIDAIKSGALSKVKSCACGKYFYQRFSHQKFCSDECRVRENQNSEKAREYRRTKQREYYHLHKTKNIK